MKPQYFYLDIELSDSEEWSAVDVRRQVECAATDLFGACGGAALLVDVLRVRGARAVLRVPARELRRLRAALTLTPRGLRVRASAPSLQALV